MWGGDGDFFLFTLEYPGGFVDQDYAQAFGVVGFEAFDHEFYGAVILIELVRAILSSIQRRISPCSPWRSLSYRRPRPVVNVSRVFFFDFKGTYCSIHIRCEKKSSGLNEIHGVPFEAGFALLSLLV